ncbi:MAG: hypothetical protein ACK506_16140 [Pirellula sp.]
MNTGRRRAAYINTGTYSTPVWVEMSRISGVQRGRSRGTADRKYRGSENVKTVTGYMTNTFTFKYHVKGPRFTTDAVLTAIEASYNNDTPLDVAFLNQRIQQPTGTFTPGANAIGVRGFVVATKMDIAEEDEEGVSIDVELREIEHEEPAGTARDVAAFSVAVVAI